MLQAPCLPTAHQQLVDQGPHGAPPVPQATGLPCGKQFPLLQVWHGHQQERQEVYIASVGRAALAETALAHAKHDHGARQQLLRQGARHWTGLQATCLPTGRQQLAQQGPQQHKPDVIQCLKWQA